MIQPALLGYLPARAPFTKQLLLLLGTCANGGFMEYVMQFSSMAMIGVARKSKELVPW